MAQVDEALDLNLNPMVESSNPPSVWVTAPLKNKKINNLVYD